MPYDLNIDGWMYETELQQIEKLSKMVPKNGVIVEVGSFCGRSSVCMAMTADPSITIYCYDYFFNSIHNSEGIIIDTWDFFKKNTKEFTNIIPVRGECPTETKYTNLKEIDLLFLDALHKNPSDWDIISYFLPFIKKGGIIAGHDFHTTQEFENPFPDVNHNVKRLHKMFNSEIIVHDRVWYLLKT
jgi:predicted O-methyltransferase YrrM